MKNKFKEIFEKETSNKAWDYADAYEDCFKDIRQDVKLVFEIGVYQGASIRGFSEYFPNALIVGIDINPDSYFEGERISIEIGDAANREFLESLVKKYGNPDIVIDDGSHFSSHIRAAYHSLFPYTKICYVIEDYGVQFKEFMNGAYIDDGVSAVNIIHKKIDDLLLTKDASNSIRIYHSCSFIFKHSMDDLL